MTLDPPLLEAVEFSSVRWSPCGKELVADRESPPGLVLVQTDSGMVTQLTRSAIHGEPSWFSDCERVLYFDRKGKGAIRSVDVASENYKPKTVLVGDGFLRMFPGALSPDDRFVVFTDRRGVVLHRMQTGDDTVLVPGDRGSNLGTMTWSPEGDALWSTTGGWIVRVDARTGQMSKVRRTSSAWFAMGLEGDVWYGFGRNDGRENEHVIVRYHPNGEDRRYVLPGPPQQLDVSRHDGTVAVAVLDRGIYIVDPESGRTEQLSQGARDCEPVWSPDGRKLAFIRTTPNNQLMIVLVRKGASE